MKSLILLVPFVFAACAPDRCTTVNVHFPFGVEASPYTLEITRRYAKTISVRAEKPQVIACEAPGYFEIRDLTATTDDGKRATTEMRTQPDEGTTVGLYFLDQSQRGDFDTTSAGLRAFVAAGTYLTYPSDPAVGDWPGHGRARAYRSDSIAAIVSEYANEPAVSVAVKLEGAWLTYDDATSLYAVGAESCMTCHGANADFIFGAQP